MTFTCIFVNTSVSFKITKTCYRRRNVNIDVDKYVRFALIECMLYIVMYRAFVALKRLHLTRG